MAILKPCIICGSLSPHARCPAHRLAHTPTRPPAPGSTTTRGYGFAWQRYAKAQVAKHLAEHGNRCPGWPASRGSHGSYDLVCDHDLGVMCRSCNSRKAATYDKRRAATQREGRAGRKGERLTAHDPLHVSRSQNVQDRPMYGSGDAAGITEEA